MLHFFVVLLAAVGATMIVVEGAIFDNVRRYVATQSKFLGTWISCPQCFGFFVGFIFSFIGLSPTYNITSEYIWFLKSIMSYPVSWFLDGCIVSLTSSFFGAIMYFLSKRQEEMETNMDYLQSAGLTELTKKQYYDTLIQKAQNNPKSSNGDRSIPTQLND